MESTINKNKQTARVLDLGIVDYDKAHKVQLQLLDKCITGKTGDTFIFTSHPPTITLGKATDDTNLLCSDAELAKRGISKYEIERGGDVTFHGPGQQIIYPIVNLNNRGKDVHKFVRDLELLIIDFLSNYNIAGRAISGKTGVWVEDKKICAIGIAVRRWVTYHGLALNLNTDLSYFDLINPCGFDSGSVTSLQKLLNKEIDLPQTFFHLVNSLEKIFKINISL